MRLVSVEAQRDFHRIQGNLIIVTPSPVSTPIHNQEVGDRSAVTTSVTNTERQPVVTTGRVNVKTSTNSVIISTVPATSSTTIDTTVAPVLSTDKLSYFLNQIDGSTNLFIYFSAVVDYCRLERSNNNRVIFIAEGSGKRVSLVCARIGLCV